MKTCPSCHTQYTDDTLRFCLQDGTPLDVSPVTEQPTVSFGGKELETAVRFDKPRSDSEVTQWKQKSEVTNVSSLNPARPSGSKTVLAVALTALAMFLLFGIVGVGAWLFLKGSGDEIALNASNGNQNASPARNTNSNVSGPAALPSPAATAISNNTSPIRINTPTPAPQIDKQQASREVSRQIDDWKSLAESRDLSSYMRKYAGTVDYYRKRGASADFVRSDKQRAFTRFSSISMSISNLSVTVDDAGERATAAFDKEWVFDGPRRSTGKVRQQLQLRKLDGQWLITGERDVKVYYTN